MAREYVEAYTYDLSYRCAGHLAKLSVRDGCYDTPDAAAAAAADSIRWYIDHGFTGSTMDDFNIALRRGYILKRLET